VQDGAELEYQQMPENSIELKVTLRKKRLL
jgi:hypothetical protein